MARPLVFQLGDRLLAVSMSKVDRARLYGYKELEVVDDRGRHCELATLADDGCTLIGKGATALGWMTADGNWCDKTQMTPVDVDGREIVSVPSSFAAPIKLFETATVDEYLRHNIRLVYAIDCDDDLSDLRSELARGTIFAFPYSYRGGLEADAGFMLANDAGEIMLAVGDPTKVDFVGLAVPPMDTETESTEEETDMMDFDMI